MGNPSQRYLPLDKWTRPASTSAR